MKEHERQKTQDSIPRYTWLLSRHPDFMASFTHPYRKVAVEHLHLQVGNRVLDAGCGTGTSFPYLVHAVGQEGEVVGVEISPAMAAQARKRIGQEGWTNVHVLEGSAQTIALSGTFDGLLLFAAHEMLTSRAALDHLLSHLKDQGAIVAFGAKLHSGSLGRLLNPLLRRFTRALLPLSSAPLEERPWQLLEERTGTLHTQELIGGFFYLVWGSLHRTPA